MTVECVGSVVRGCYALLALFNTFASWYPYVILSSYLWCDLFGDGSQFPELDVSDMCAGAGNSEVGPGPDKKANTNLLTYWLQPRTTTQSIPSAHPLWSLSSALKHCSRVSLRSISKAMA